MTDGALVTAAASLAAGLGAVGRVALDKVVRRRSTSVFPLGILAVNVLGSLLLGLVLGLSAHRGLPAGPTLVLGGGLAGGFTTLSTWAWDTLVLHEAGTTWAGAANVVVSVATCLLAGAVGLGLALL